MKPKLSPWMTALALALPLVTQANPHEDGDDHPSAPGNVYTMDNAPAGNQVWQFGRRPDGSLTPARTYATGGLGTGSGLGNQGSVLSSPDGRWLFVCNAGSNEISVFEARPSGLILRDKVPSQGTLPVSLTLHRNLLYVLNAGGADSIAGFVFAHGHLVPLPDSIHPLSGQNTRPAQVGFTSDGDHLVVTEKATGLVDVFTLDSEGLPTELRSFVSPDPAPFGLATGSRNRVLVVQTAGGGANPGGSTLSSYQVGGDGDLSVLSDSVPTHQTSACWVLLSRNERFAFTANTPNDSLSSFRVGHDGRLELLAAQAGLPGAGSRPSDMAISRDDRFLYSLNAGNGTVTGFRVGQRSGGLSPLGNVGVVRERPMVWLRTEPCAETP